MTKRKIRKKSKKKNINLTTLNDNNSHKINNNIFIKDIIEDIINIIEKKSNNIQINIKKSSEKYIHNDINNSNNIKNTNNTNIIEKNKKNVLNNFFEELDIVSNPIHGKYGQEKQIEQVIYNNYIISNYIDEKWNSFLTFFRLKN
jgi:hypothetical protein